MVFQLEKFNDKVSIDMSKTFGELIFMGFKEAQYFEDNKPVEGKMIATHVELFSEKLGDSFEFKLPHDYFVKEVPIMAEVIVEGKGSPIIYRFTNSQIRNNEVNEFSDYGISVRIQDFKVKGQQNQAPKVESKQDLKQETK